MTNDRTEPIVTISTGWMFAHGQTAWSDQQPFLSRADGAELSLVRDTARFETYEDSLPDWADLSFHLSTDLPEYDRIASLVAQHDPRATVLHPDDEFSAEMVEAYLTRGVPIAIENLDKRLSGGMTVDEIVQVLDTYDLPLVFDVQHAYEHDHSMEYAWELLQASADRLTHFHVSGERIREDDSVNRHALVRDADNREAILTFIDEAFAAGHGCPMVIEGEYASPADVQDEVALLKKAARGSR